jgi:hypothetical protein
MPITQSMKPTLTLLTALLLAPLAGLHAAAHSDRVELGPPETVLADRSR